MSDIVSKEMNKIALHKNTDYIIFHWIGSCCLTAD